MERKVLAAAIYVRISQDREGTMLGVERQEALCGDLAKRKGWQVAEVYVDNDISAYSGKPRPAYERMLEDLQAGIRDGVVVVDTDRLTRSPAELVRFIDLADRFAIALANASGDLDLSTSDGRFKARILGAVARQESEKKSERLRRQRAQLAARGRPHPGPRAFGYEPGREKVHTGEAAMIRSAAKAVLSGRSLRSIADEWNTAGVTTSRGRRWTVNAVRDVLTSPSTAGLRLHRGVVVGEGAWPAILDRATHERLVALATARRRAAGRPPTRLLSGITTCGVCGKPMRSSTSDGVAIYACRRQPGKDEGCGRLSIVADPLDAEVRDQMLASLAGEGLARAIRAYSRDDAYRDLAAQLERDEAALLELSDDFYVTRTIGRAEFLRVREQLERRIAASRAGLAGDRRSSVLTGLPPDTSALREWWDAAPSDARRALVEALVERVDVAPLDPGKPRRFHPDRLEVVWRA